MPVAPDSNPEDVSRDSLDEFLRREVETMEVFLTAKAIRSATSIEEYINTRLLQGASQESIESDLLDDLENGGRIFAEFRNAVRATSNGVMNRVRDTGIYADAGIEAEFRWVAVLVNTCPDCLERHGTVLSYADWESAGLPRTGVTVCRENCHCMLLPAKTAVLEPIQRKK